MFNSQILDVAIGLVFIYFFLSLLCSVIIEGVTSLIRKRPRMLHEAISLLLGGDTKALEKLYEQPLFMGNAPKGLVKSLGESLLTLLPLPSGRLEAPKVPSYISSRSFVLSLLEGLKQHPEVVKKILQDQGIILPDSITKINEFKDKLDALSIDDKIKKDLGTLVQEPAKDAEKLEKIRDWYDKPEVLAELIKPFKDKIPSLANVDGLVNLLPDDNKIKQTLAPLVELAENKLDKTMEGMEKWYDEAMGRVTGWYKRYSQTFALILAIFVALVLNVDTFAMGKAIYRDQVLRSSLVAMAEDAAKQAGKTTPTADSKKPEVGKAAPAVIAEKTAENQPPAQVTSDLEKRIQAINKDYQKISSLNLPLGWPLTAGGWPDMEKIFDTSGLLNLTKILGILFTALMVSLGSNFWFELLNKLINMRNAGKKPLTKEEVAQKK